MATRFGSTWLWSIRSPAKCAQPGCFPRPLATAALLIKVTKTSKTNGRFRSTATTLHMRNKHTVYRSPFKEPPLPQPTSLFHFHFPPDIRDKARDSLTAYVDALSGDTLTQGQVREYSLRIGYGLQNLNGIKKGDVALIFSTNSLEYAVTFFACQAAGLIVTPASASYTPHELAYHIKDSTAKIAFIQPDLLGTFQKAETILNEEEKGRTNLQAYSLTSAKNALLEDGKFSSYEALSLEPGTWKGEALRRGEEHTAAVLCYSSGTVNTNPFMRCICFPILNHMTLISLMRPVDRLT
jgi:hypothetical protein